MKMIDGKLYLTDAEFDQWLVDLRSGRYLQGAGRLKQHGFDGKGQPRKEHCCLGVLGEQLNCLVEVEFNGYECVLPGVKGDAYYLPVDNHNRLAGMNDGTREGGWVGGLRKSFPEIADWLEEHRSQYIIPAEAANG